MRTFMLVALACLLVAEGVEGTGHGGSGSKSKDTGSKKKDTGSKSKDTGSKPKDTGSKKKDTGSKPKDTGSKPKDTGSKPKDTGSKPKDTGSKKKDTGSKPKDTGSKPKDTGSKPKDTGSKPKDTGSKPKGDDNDDRCKTSWAKGSRSSCISRSWGAWSNKMYKGNTETMKIWSGASQCDVRNGEHVGNAVISFNGGKVTVTTTMFAGFSVRASHLYVGSSSNPNRVPSSFPWKKSGSADYSVNIQSCLKTYVALHVDVCEDAAPPPPCDDAGTHSAIVRDMWRPMASNTLPAYTVSEGMMAWRFDEGSAYLHNFPEVLLRPGVQAFFPDQNNMVATGSHNAVKCPENCGDHPCEVIVVAYHCPPCSSATNGGFPASMPVEGWTAGHCAPRFRYLSDRHRMVGFRKLVPAGEVEELPETSGPLSNYAIFVRQGAYDCSEYGAQNTCSAVSECKWENNECVSDWCFRVPPNGPPTCTPCAPTTLDD